jgi:hypothetical protein
LLKYLQERSQLKYKKYLLFNKNILIGYVCASLTGAITSQIIAPKLTFALNSIITLIIEDVVFYTIFGILFYVNNKRENNFTKQQQRSTTLHSTRFEDVKWVIVKLVSTMSIAELEYNLVKPYVQYWLLTQRFEPFIASVIASLVGIAGFIAVADLMAYYTSLFRKNKE